MDTQILKGKKIEELFNVGPERLEELGRHIDALTLDDNPITVMRTALNISAHKGEAALLFMAIGCMYAEQINAS